MKIRTDFVTNSSSSSFVLARKGELNQKQKDAVIAYIERRMLGKSILKPDSSEKEIKEAFEENYGLENHRDIVRNALADGKEICEGWVSFECCDDEYADLFWNIWKILENNADGNFEVIEDDLSY